MIAPTLVAHMLNTLLAGLAIALFAWAFLRWFAPRTSSVRFAVWFSSLLLIAGLPFASTVLSSGNSSGIAAGTQGQPEFTFPALLAVYLFAGWAVIALLFLARLAASLWHVYRLRQHSTEVDPAALDLAIQDVLQCDRPSRKVKLCISDELRSPAALGFFRPAIVVPRWVWDELTVNELRVVVLHELSHLTRWDDWTNLAQKVIKALFFFHPAVWWIDRRLTLEREMACDDMVLARTASPKDYAASLISLAERAHLGRGVVLVQAFLGRARQTSARIAQILDSDRPSAPAGVWKSMLSSFVGVAVLMVLVVPNSPQWVAFEDRTLPVVTASATSVPEIPNLTAEPARVVPVRQGTAVQAEPVVVASAHKKPALHRYAGVIQASAKVPANSATQVVLVVQTTQYTEYGPSGAAVFTFSVWRVSEIGAKQPGTGEVLAKKL